MSGQPIQEDDVGLINGLIKAGIAKKVIDEARKPHNQQKIKDAVRNLQSKKGGGRSSY